MTGSSIPSVPKVGALKHLGKVPAPFLIVDPGKRTGIGVYTSDGFVQSRTLPLDELPAFLRQQLEGDTPIKFVVCEDYHLVGGKLGAAQAGSDIPSAIGIGMCRTACEYYDVALYLVQPRDKKAGHMFFNGRSGGAHASLLASFGMARNDHERDVVDLAGFVLREILT